MFGNQYAGNTAIQRRRDEENRLRTMKNIVSTDKTTLQMADWEQKTDNMIKRSMIKNITLNLENQSKAVLSQRQAKLRALLTAEDEQYRTELAALQETSSEKAKRMVNVARDLKAKREDERKQFAQAQLERQWRLGCDDLRDLEGEQFKNYCLAKVQDQRNEKIMARVASRDEEEKWATAWEQERMKQVDRDDRENRERKAFNYETKMDLLNQMRQKRADDEQNVRDQEAERSAFRKNLADDERSALAEQQRRAAKQKREMELILQGNEQQLSAKRMQAQFVREQEMKDLEQAEEEHKADLAAKADEKRKMREEMAAYRDYLGQRKEQEAVLDKELEGLCLEEMERANDKRDQQWMREKLAREALMRNVYEGRYEQVKEKEASAYKDEMQLYYERQCMDREIEEANNMENEEDRIRGEHHRIRKRELDNQTQHINNRKQLEEARVMQEEEMALQAERQYRGFLNREKANFERTQYQPKPFGLKNVIS